LGLRFFARGSSRPGRCILGSGASSQHFPRKDLSGNRAKTKNNCQRAHLSRHAICFQAGCPRGGRRPSLCGSYPRHVVQASSRVPRQSWGSTSPWTGPVLDFLNSRSTPMGGRGILQITGVAFQHCHCEGLPVSRPPPGQRGSTPSQQHKKVELL
jgi:hypothetical protein